MLALLLIAARPPSYTYRENMLALRLPPERAPKASGARSERERAESGARALPERAPKASGARSERERAESGARALPERAPKASGARSERERAESGARALPEHPTVVSWRRLDPRGRGVGAWSRRDVGGVLKEGQVELEVGSGGGHELRISSARGTERIWATRGTWYALPRENAITTGHKPSLRGSALAAIADITLAGAFSVQVNTVRQRGYLAVGRTLGMDLGAAIRPPEEAALVVVGGGTMQGAVVTLTEHREKDQVVYWDYPLNLEVEARRYVIPLSAFERRDGRGKGKIERIEAITIRTVQIPNEGDRLFFDHLALLESPPRITGVQAAKNGVIIQTGGRVLLSERLHAEGAATSTSARVRKKTMRLSGPGFAGATKVWMCWREDGAEACDPPDAPTTVRQVPVVPPAPLLVDDFAGSIPVNALRRQTQVYTSTIGLDPTLVSLRRPGSILLGRLEERHLDYVGYLSPLPPVLPSHLSELELTIRGDVDPALIKVGLRSTNGREPKVAVNRYLKAVDRERWQTVRIPLTAFGRSRKNVDAITVSLEAAGGRKQQLEIQRIEISPARKGG